MKDQEIKDLWQSADQDSKFSYTDDTLKRVLAKGSQSVVSRFINTLKFERAVNVASFLCLTAYMLHLRNVWAGIFTLLLNAVIYFGYIHLIYKLSIPLPDQGVLQYLREVKKVIRKFISHYRLASLILGLPIYLVVLHHFKGDKVWNELLNNPHFLITNSIGVILAYLVVITLIHLLYGRKYSKIKKMIHSLSESET